MAKLRHNEGFKLMKYRGEKTGRIEWIWNSRDGVTPFSCGTVETPEEGGEILQHVDWNEDAFIPNYIPPIGTRVFTDHTKETAEAALKLREERFGPLPSYLDRQAIIKDIMEGTRVAVVCETMHKAFRALAEHAPHIVARGEVV